MTHALSSNLHLRLGRTARDRFPRGGSPLNPRFGHPTLHGVLRSAAAS